MTDSKTMAEEDEVLDFDEAFVEYVKQICADGDCYPQPAMTCTEEGEVAILAMALSPPDLYQTLVQHAADPNVVQLAFGFDRTTRPGQGTELSDVFTYCILEVGAEPRFGIIEYDKEGDVRQRELQAGDFWFDQQASHYQRIIMAFNRTVPN